MAEMDMNQLVDDVLLQLELSRVVIPKNLVIGNLGLATCDESLIKQVWMNLVSNAIKYSANKTSPEIHISVKHEKDKLIYQISDNGAGFDMLYYNKLFGVFQRLHKQEEFPGTGVGLAIVQRIIFRHGGKVWAEGKKGEGANFFFSLPKIVDKKNIPPDAGQDMSVLNH